MEGPVYALNDYPVVFALFIFSFQLNSIHVAFIYDYIISHNEIYINVWADFFGKNWWRIHIFIFVLLQNINSSFRHELYLGLLWHNMCKNTLILMRSTCIVYVDRSFIISWFLFVETSGLLYKELETTRTFYTIVEFLWTYFIYFIYILYVKKKLK